MPCGCRRPVKERILNSGRLPLPGITPCSNMPVILILQSCLSSERQSKWRTLMQKIDHGNAFLVPLLRSCNANVSDEGASLPNVVEQIAAKCGMTRVELILAVICGIEDVVLMSCRPPRRWILIEISPCTNSSTKIRKIQHRMRNSEISNDTLNKEDGYQDNES